MGELAKPQIMPYSELSTDITLFDVRWVPCSTRFVVAGTHANGHGVLRVYGVSSGGQIEPTGLKVERGHPFKCLTFGASTLEDRNPATGDFDGNVDVWDVERMKAVWSAKGHSSVVNAIDGRVPELATASRDGSVKVWDVRVKDKPTACMQPQGGKRDCWAAAFGDNGEKLVAGYDNGDVKMFDLRNMKIHWETHVPNGVCSLSFDRPDIAMNKLMATCLQGRVHVWDLRTMSKRGFAEWTEKVEKGNHTIWNGRFLTQNREVVATMGGGGSVTLWKYAYPSKRVVEGEDGEEHGVAGSLQRIQEAQLSDQPVTGFDWSPDKTGLAVTTAFDQKIRLVIVTKLNAL